MVVELGHPLDYNKLIFNKVQSYQTLAHTFGYGISFIPGTWWFRTLSRTTHRGILSFTSSTFTYFPVIYISNTGFSQNKTLMSTFWNTANLTLKSSMSRCQSFPLTLRLQGVKSLQYSHFHWKKKANSFLKIFILTSITTLYHECMNLIQQAFIIIVWKITDYLNRNTWLNVELSPGFSSFYKNEENQTLLDFGRDQFRVAI